MRKIFVKFEESDQTKMIDVCKTQKISEGSSTSLGAVIKYEGKLKNPNSASNFHIGVSSSK